MKIRCIRVVDREENPDIPETGELTRGMEHIYSEDICGVSSWGSPPGEANMDRLLTVDPTLHDYHVSNILCTASAWAYSDIDTLSRVMHCRGLMPKHETVGITNTNPALFIDTIAYLIQSEDRKVAILCFRGTGLQNVVNWLADASVSPEPFMSMGRVHGGFLRGLLTLWPMLGKLLMHALCGQSICDAVRSPGAMIQRRSEDDPRGIGCAEPVAERGGAPEPPGAGSSQFMTERQDRLKALYITGHSLGGALAVLAAALIWSDPLFEPLREKLRGIYTYGQPMVGDAGFRAHFEEKLGPMVFRHIYGNDLVPRMPPKTTGKFFHIGKEYASSDTGWVRRGSVVRQLHTFAMSNALGILALLRKQLIGIPFIGWIPLGVSWGDHSPLNYLRTSQQPAHGSEVI
ncbi:lipase family protein [Sorangium sp. So ce693]|uniref:lipase family protein n=1 Tax=Sorangium sp. So ce693 TaxID=3133318 RepID=UPI003F5DA844